GHGPTTVAWPPRGCQGRGRARGLYWGVPRVQPLEIRRTMPKKSRYKVVILGSGPAGLTAALYASRASLEPLVVEGGGGSDPTDIPGGQLMLTTDVDNYPGFPGGILGPELMEKMRQQAERFGAEFVSGQLEEADLHARPFALK